jgi:hypothetical protein
MARKISAMGVVVVAVLVAWSLSKSAAATPLTCSPSVSQRDPAIFLYYLPFVSSECSAFPPLEWDPRLGPGGLPHLENVRIIPANVAQGQKFWRVIKVKFEDINESGNDHTIYVKVLGEDCLRVDGKKLHLTSEGGLSEYPEEKPAGDLCDCNFDYPMYGDGYNVQIEDQYPSDMVAGMIMPMRRHVNYRITFQLSTQP